MKKLVVTLTIIASLGLHSAAFAGSSCCPLSSKSVEDNGDLSALADEENGTDVLLQDETQEDAAEVASVEQE